MIAVQRNVKELIDSLGIYEQKYLLYRKTVDDRHDELYEKTLVLFNQLEDSNRKFIDTAVIPLSNKIEDGFLKIADTLHSDMLNISNIFSNLENPLQSPYDVFSNSLDTVYKRLTEITEHLYKKFDEVEVKNTKFVNLLDNISDKNDLLLNKLLTNDGIQNKQLNILSTAIELLIEEKHPIKSRLIRFLEKIRRIMKTKDKIRSQA